MLCAILLTVGLSIASCLPNPSDPSRFPVDEAAEELRRMKDEMERQEAAADAKIDWLHGPSGRSMPDEGRNGGR